MGGKRERGKRRDRERKGGREGKERLRKGGREGEEREIEEGRREGKERWRKGGGREGGKKNLGTEIHVHVYTVHVVGQ